MSIRYVVSFPQQISQSQAREIQSYLRAAADARDFRDLVIDSGGTITDMRRSNSISALVRRARAKAR